jgi:hypothetical protein
MRTNTPMYQSQVSIKNPLDSNSHHTSEFNSHEKNTHNNSLPNNQHQNHKEEKKNHKHKEPKANQEASSPNQVNLQKEY